MSRAYDLVVFDWEGTLGDPLGYVLHVIEEQAKTLGIAAFDERVARRNVIYGLEIALKKIFPDLLLHQYEQLFHQIQQILHSHPSEQCLFPGAKKLVQQLQAMHIDLAIATNKGPHALQRALQSTGLDAFFAVTRAAGQAPAKPCPQMLEEIMQTFHVSPHATLMIGDSVTDVEMALSAGVNCVGVDFYYQHREELQKAGATQVFDDYEAIGRFLGLDQLRGAL